MGNAWFWGSAPSIRYFPDWSCSDGRFPWVWKLGFISIRLTQNLHYLTRELGNWSWSSCVFLKAHLYETKTSPNPSNKKKNLQSLIIKVFSAFAFSVQISHIFSAGWKSWRKFPQTPGTFPRYPTSRPKKLKDSLHKSVVIRVSWVCFFRGLLNFFFGKFECQHLAGAWKGAQELGYLKIPSQ